MTLSFLYQGMKIKSIESLTGIKSVFNQRHNATDFMAGCAAGGRILRLRHYIA
jgi:hypothetical protein